MAAQEYTQKLHDALVKAERALCYVLGFDLECDNGYADPLSHIVPHYHLQHGCEGVAQVAWDFILLRCNQAPHMLHISSGLHHPKQTLVCLALWQAIALSTRACEIMSSAFAKQFAIPW